MKIYASIICVCFLLTSCKSNKNSIKHDVFSCEAGVTEAINDAKENKYKLISYGLMIQIKTDGFSNFYSDFMRKNYDIYYSSGGCVSTQSSICYKEKIKELIYKKYGNNIFEESKLEAIKEFRETKEFIEEIKPKIDSGKVYSQ
jgi:hypothetical protein